MKVIKLKNNKRLCIKNKNLGIHITQLKSVCLYLNIKFITFYEYYNLIIINLE